MIAVASYVFGRNTDSAAAARQHTPVITRMSWRRCAKASRRVNGGLSSKSFMGPERPVDPRGGREVRAPADPSQRMIGACLEPIRRDRSRDMGAGHVGWA